MERTFFAYGIVRAVSPDGRLAYIALDADADASGCGRAGGCGGACERAGTCANPFASLRSEHTLPAENTVGAIAGQRVVVTTRRGLRIYASLRIFFIPLLIFFAAYFAGYTISKENESAAIAFALVLPSIYYVLVYVSEKRKSKKNTHHLQITRILH